MASLLMDDGLSKMLLLFRPLAGRRRPWYEPSVADRVGQPPLLALPALFFGILVGVVVFFSPGVVSPCKMNDVADPY